MTFEVEELLTEDGKNPFSDWFNSLPSDVAARISTAVYRMELGNLSNVKWFDGIGEYKLDFGPGYRIYLAKDGLKIIFLLGGGTKKNQQKDIDNAMALWEDYKARKKKAAKTSQKSGKSKE